LRTIAGDVVHLHNGVTPLGSFQATGGDLLCLGRLARHKHVERLIAALAEAPLAEVTLHVVGPEWDVSRLEVAQWAEQLGVSERVRIYGRVNDKLRADIAKHCALFVSASSYEGFGMSMIEAMSVGLIPVVHANEAFVELVDAANCGALVDFTRPHAAASIIRKHLDQIDDAQRLHAAKFAERFSWSGHAEKTLALYREARGDRVHRAA
jgi:alpha-1,3-mannosyltransferase